MYEQTAWEIYDAKKGYTTKIEQSPIQINQIIEIIIFLKDDTIEKKSIQIGGLKLPPRHTP